jgi:hypothetical protein
MTAETSTPPGTQFTFDTTDTLIPFIFVRQSAHLTPVYLKRLEVGRMIEAGKDPYAG